MEQVVAGQFQSLGSNDMLFKTNHTGLIGGVHSNILRRHLLCNFHPYIDIKPSQTPPQCVLPCVTTEHHRFLP